MSVEKDRDWYRNRIDPLVLEIQQILAGRVKVPDPAKAEAQRFAEIVQCEKAINCQSSVARTSPARSPTYSQLN